MIDMHSHVLHKIDDGSKSVEMSMKMLRESANQGITDILATPHFYITVDNVNSFLKKREHAFKRLNESMAGETGLPNLYCGAEVYYFNGISNYEGLEKLTINNTEFLLLEMPFNKWTSRVFQEVEDIIYNRKLIPVIAHIERYIGFQKGTDNIERLLSMKVIAQMNSEYILGMFTKGKAIKLLAEGAVRLLGSDMHNTESRPQTLGKACAIIEKKLGSKILDDIEQLSREIIGI